MTTTRIWAALAAAVIWVGLQPAGAQPFNDRERVDTQFYGPDGRIVLFDRPGFNGGAYSANGDVRNLGPTGFNDQAASITVRRGERWQVCEHQDFRGRCVIVDRDIPDLRSVGLAYAISSLRRLGGGGGGPGMGNRPPAQGETAVFYPTPRRRNGDYVEACQGRFEDRRCQEQQTDRFCREMGHREGAYFQTRNGYLIDVLCRR